MQSMSSLGTVIEYRGASGHIFSTHATPDTYASDPGVACMTTNSDVERRVARIVDVRRRMSEISDAPLLLRPE